ncbi:hypothetical protein HY29_03215 [Hyphomonas beringensis]|uniref:Tetratricopeptide repeat protein n=1 Tax=Hyphomonas beringensis TaxID=1280946 RepID=A0A062U1B6_9PROT|nr:tetratricopeptide repeat protein [Hyphomonas beringensis]KCZ54096.1 hypothetical protein HY29_03215 [Hyphomonas beringensis]
MALIKDCTQHACAFVFGCTGVALGIGGAGLTAGIGGAALVGTCVAAVYEGKKKHSVENKRELERLICRTTDEWREQPEFQKHDPGRDLSDASDALIEYLPKCDMSRDRLIKHAAEAPGRPFPDAATDHVLAELTRLAPEVYGEGGTPIARDFATAIIRSAFAAAIENRAYYEQLEPHLLFEIARTQGLTISLLDDVLHEIEEVKAGVAEINENVSDLPAALVEHLVQAGIVGGLSRPQVETILASFGHENVPEEMWEAKLKESAARLDELEARLKTLTNDEPEIANLLQRAGDAIDAADFETADALLAEAEQRDVEAGEMRLTRAARSREQRGDLARSSGKYVEAAEHYAEAASRVQSLDPLDWARLKYKQGLALYERGQFDPEPQLLQESVAAYREALKQYTRERVPLKWAMTQNNLGTALQTLGVRGNDDALRDAIAAYREALKERTRERVPLKWATTQNNLGNALLTLGERGDDDSLHDAIAAYRDALKERTRERVPLEWAMTQNNLGNALLTLGERGDDDSLHDAIAAYRDALKERTRERVPLEWAMTQNNLGNALATLGERGDDEVLERAVEAYRQALEEFTVERTPYQHGGVSRNLAEAEALLKERKNGGA